MMDFNNAPLLLRKWSRVFFLLVTVSFMSVAMSHVYSQITALVFSPEVIAEEAVADFRVAYDADEDRWAYRNHLQYGLSDSFSLRGIVLHTIDSSDQWDFRFFRIEGFWQFLEDEKAGWDSALRFDLEIAEGDNLPSIVRLAWSGMYDLDDYWQVRGNVLTGYEIGPDSDPGVLVEARAQINRRLSKTVRFGFDYFGNMNNTASFGNWESQRHRLGPTLSAMMGENVRVIGGALLGLSRAASDSEYRFMIMRIF